MGKLRIGALLAAAALTLSFAGTALGDAYATVDGHAPFSSELNHAAYWEGVYDADCTKIVDSGELASWETPADYLAVIVKAGAGNVDPFTNTIFDNTSKGQVVWADTNGNKDFDFGGKDGDKAISHIIVCVAKTTTTTEETTTTTATTTTTETETTATTTTTTVSTDTETTETETTATTAKTTTTTPEGAVEELTPPRTDALAQPTSSSSVPTSLLLVLAGILAAALVVIPAAARRR